MNRISCSTAPREAFRFAGVDQAAHHAKSQNEYATLAAEKKKLYSGYRAKKEEMIALLMAKQNVDRLLEQHRSSAKREPDRNSRDNYPRFLTGRSAAQQTPRAA
jgi:hypothetical protein